MQPQKRGENNRVKEDWVQIFNMRAEEVYALRCEDRSTKMVVFLLLGDAETVHH